MIKAVIYSCGNCQGLHEWETSKCNGATRYTDEQDYAARHGIREEDISVLSMSTSREDRDNETMRRIALSQMTRRRPQ
jgi:hypothetical protein